MKINDDIIRKNIDNVSVYFFTDRELFENHCVDGILLSVKAVHGMSQFMHGVLDDDIYLDYYYCCHDSIFGETFYYVFVLVKEEKFVLC